MRIGNKHPAGAAAHGFPHRDELCSPSILTSEVSRERLAQRGVRDPAVTEPIEVQLMQDHRVRCDQFFALQSIDHEHGCCREIHARELRRDGVEPLHGTAIVVLPVTDDQLLRETLELLGIAGERSHVVRHCSCLIQRSPGVVSASSNKSRPIVGARRSRQTSTACERHTPGGRCRPFASGKMRCTRALGPMPLSR